MGVRQLPLPLVALSGLGTSRQPLTDAPFTSQVNVAALPDVMLVGSAVKLMIVGAEVWIGLLPDETLMVIGSAFVVPTLLLQDRL